MEAAPQGRWRNRVRAASEAAPAVDVADLYRQLAPAVLGYLRSQTGPEPEDLLGEIFLQVVRDIGRFRGDEVALRRWVFSIAHHRLVDARRRSRRRPPVADSPVPERPAPPAAEPVDPELIGALAALTAEQREVVALRFVADLPIDAVAAVTGRSTGAVKALQHRALQALARELGEGWAPISATGT